MGTQDEWTRVDVRTPIVNVTFSNVWEARMSGRQVHGLERMVLGCFFVLVHTFARRSTSRLHSIGTDPFGSKMHSKLQCTGRPRERCCDACACHMGAAASGNGGHTTNNAPGGSLPTQCMYMRNVAAF